MEELIGIAHICLAVFLGSLIGLEREWKNKPAGFRTHAFVAGASAALIIIAPSIVRAIIEGFPIDSLRVEPLSIVQAIFLAVGFIAGGLAIKDMEKKQVLNLTTTATLLWSCVVGMTAATELYITSIALTALALAMNLIPWKIEQKQNV